MSRFESFIDALTSPVSGGGGRPAMETAGDRRRRAEWRKLRRKQAGKPEPVEKQSVDRRAEAFAQLESTVGDSGGVSKPYDPVFLRDIAANAVVQAYVDTLAQDAASANWKLKPRDEDTERDDEDIADEERKLRDLHPELPFRDVIEETARILLEFGDSTWVKHYYKNSDELAEMLVVDSATMFKRVDSHGITQGYLQASRRAQDVAAEFDRDEVVWFSWSLRPDRHYGEGPLEKAQDEVELLEELASKERLDLVAGSPPGVVSPDFTDDFGTVPDEDWDTFVEGMQLDEGERHRVGYSKIPIDFEPITPSYQELQILERSKYWVSVLGSVFKVNPSYAGFDFENTNRATDETQQEAYAQRGFRVLLRQLEEGINRGLVWQDISEDLKFEFEREQTVAEKKERADLIESQANAARAIAGAIEEGEDVDGAPVQYRDGQIVVEDGDVIPEEDGSDGGMGGFFASVDDPDEADVEMRQKAEGGDSGNPNGADSDDDDTLALSADELAAYDRHLLKAHASQIQPESVDDIEKRAWNRDESVPEYVRQGVLNAIERGAIFDSFETVPGTLRETLEDILRDSLTQSQGWSLDSIVDRMRDAFPGVDGDALETVARTETSSVLNRARETGYENREDADRFKYYWQGSVDSRTTQCCEDLMIATGVESGTPETPFSEVPGEAVDMATLVRLEREASDHHFPDLSFRRHVPHINCRKTFVRDASAEVDIDVDVPDAAEFNKSVCKCDHDADVDYRAVVKRMAKDIDRSNRERQIERALGESMPQVLRRAFVESGGSVEPAKRQINDRLRKSPSYDDEEFGVVSKPTLYNWKGKYENALGDVV